MSDDLAAVVGDRVRTTRRDRGLSLAALADAAGVGKGSLSEIENGSRNPTLSTLYALAGALAVPLSALLAERPGAELSSPGIRGRLLETTHHDDGTTVEVYLLRLDADADHRSAGHGRGVVEHFLVTSGRAAVGPLRRMQEVGVGEAVTWESRGAHRYRALDHAPVEAVLVIRWPPA